MKLECKVFFVDGTSAECEGNISLLGPLLDEASELYCGARECAIEMFLTYPESIAILFGSKLDRSAVIFPRPGSHAAREFVSLLQDKAVKAGTRIGSGQLDS
jgi:hypothetical protein